jgi:hypothetical protein
LPYIHHTTRGRLPIANHKKPGHISEKEVKKEDIIVTILLNETPQIYVSIVP